MQLEVHFLLERYQEMTKIAYELFHPADRARQRHTEVLFLSVRVNASDIA